MNKKEKLYDLLMGISIRTQKLKFLLENIAYKSDSELETQVFAEIAMEQTSRISRMSRIIGKIIKY